MLDRRDFLKALAAIAAAGSGVSAATAAGVSTSVPASDEILLAGAALREIELLGQIALERQDHRWMSTIRGVREYILAGGAVPVEASPRKDGGHRLVYFMPECGMPPPSEELRSQARELLSRHLIFSVTVYHDCAFEVIVG